MDRQRGIPFDYHRRQQEPPTQSKPVHMTDNPRVYGHFEHVIIPQILKCITLV